MELTAGKWRGLRRMADDDGRFKMLAVDQRPPIKNLIAKVRGVDNAPDNDVADVKRALAECLSGEASAVLMDPHGAYPAAADVVAASKGLIATLEDSLFEQTAGGRRSSQIDDWSVAKIKRIGADGVKVLAWYRPDGDPDICRYQEDFVAEIGDACRTYDIPFVFELLVYPLPGEENQTTDYVEHRSKHPERVIESVERFADPKFGVDLFKLESPVPAADLPDPDGPDGAATQELFDRMGKLAGRPWVMLSAGADKPAFKRVLNYAYAAGASGYLAGRAIWWQAFQHFPDLQAMRAELSADGTAYMREIGELTDQKATPWQSHGCYGDGGADFVDRGAGFRHAYPDFDGAD